MKNLFKSLMLVAVAAMAFASCAKSDDVAVGRKVDVVLNLNIDDVRTSFGEPTGTTYPVKWDGDEELKISLNYTSAKDADVVVADGKASVSTTLTAEEGTTEFTILALSPASSFVGLSGGTYKSWNVMIPTAQTPTATSCDAAAQILAAKSATSTVLEGAHNVTFNHVTAYGKMSFLNLALGEAKIASVEITSSKDIAGRFYYYPETKTTTVNSGSKTIAVTTEATENIWFACAPVDLSGSALKVVVNTDKGTFTKEVTIPAGAVLTPGKIAEFNVDMAGIAIEAPVKYELLLNAANLTAGDYAIIVAADTDVAISTTQNNNNRGEAAVTIEGNYVVSPGDAVEVFSVEAGTKAGTFAFKSATGYIFAASSSSNYMKTQATNNDNGSWKITVTDGVADVVAQGANTRNCMRHNTTSSVFSCYASTSSVAEKVKIYYISNNTDPMISAANINDVPAEGVTNATAEISVRNLTEAVVATCDGTVVTAASVSGSILTYTVAANTGEAREGWIKLAANGVECTIAVSQQVSATMAKYYVKVTEVTAGGKYLIVAGTKAAAIVGGTKTYGYLPVSNVTVEGDKIMLDDKTEALAWEFTAVSGGYTIKGSDGKYLYMTGTYNSFNLTTSATQAGNVWVCTANGDGTFKVTNKDKSKYMQYTSGYNTYGAYSSMQSGASLPSLYKLEE